MKKEEIKSRFRIKLKSYDNKVIDNSTRQIVEIGLRSGVSIVGPIPLPTEIHKYTVNRSSFIHKDAREQFEMRIHKRLIEILDPNQKFIDALRDLTLPAGVEIEVKTT
ncbi:MAG: 30S ribosomal protein S10 [Parcubacteria group bacterium CG2_30_36_21]|nr:MAG: 30S ribosomal protein S10 [Parcubacteria group bacterium CG2_30_36_21]